MTDEDGIQVSVGHFILFKNESKYVLLFILGSMHLLFHRVTKDGLAVSSESRRFFKVQRNKYRPVMTIEPCSRGPRFVIIKVKDLNCLQNLRKALLI